MDHFFELSPDIDAGADVKQDIYFYWPNGIQYWLSMI